jgi:hypothetical protein
LNETRDYISCLIQAFSAFKPSAQDKVRVSNMADELAREPFAVDESSFDFLDVTAESDTPQEDSSPLESVELPDAEKEAEEVDAEPETAEEEKPEEEIEEEPEKESEKPVTDKDLTVEKDGKVYDFSSAPKEMREVVRTQNKLVNAFLRDNIETVQAELQNLSPSSYTKLASQIVQQSAETNPAKWAEYLIQTNKETVKTALLGEEFKDVNLEAVAELARIYREDSEEGDELRTILELRNPEFSTTPVKQLEPAEKAELEELRREKKEKSESTSSTEVQAVYEKVFDYADETVVAPKVKEFGLMPEASDTPEVIREKRRVVNSLASIIDSELSSDPETKDDYKKLLDKIQNRDESGAMALLPSITDKMEEITISYLGFIRNQQTASLKQKHTPARKAPVALAVGKKVEPAPKALTLAERLETASDDEILRNMGITT